MLGRDFEDEVRSRSVFELASNPIGYFGKMNSTLGSVVPLAMFRSQSLWEEIDKYRTSPQRVPSLSNGKAHKPIGLKSSAMGGGCNLGAFPQPETHITAY